MRYLNVFRTTIELMGEGSAIKRLCCGIAILILAWGCQSRHETKISQGTETAKEPVELAEMAEVRRDSSNTSVSLGVVVEKVPESLALETAGIQAGDVLLSWKRLPNPSTNMESAEGEFECPFDLHLLRLEQAPRGVVEILGERKGVGKIWRIEPGKWREFGVRPQWTGPRLELYLQGLERIESGKLVEGVTAWQDLLEALSHEKECHQRDWILFELARFWLGVGRGLPDAEGNFERIVEVFEAQPESQQAAYSLRELGKLFESRSDLDQAHSLYDSVLQTRLRLLPHSLLVAHSFNDLGNIATKAGNLDQAEDHFTHSLRIRELIAPESLVVADSLNNLGIVAITRGALSRGQEFHSQSLQIRERAAPESLIVAASLNNLGVVAWSQGNQLQAQEFYTRARRIFEHLAPEGLELANCLTNLGIIANDRGDMDQAKELLASALRIQMLIAPEGLGVANILNNLGLVASNRGDLDRAAALYARSLRTKEQFAPESLNVALTLSNQGNIAAERGQIYEARELHSRALRIRENLAPGSPGLAVSLQNLGFLFRDQGDIDSAYKFLTRAQEILEEVAPVGLEMAAGLFGLGSIDHDRGQLEEAKEKFSRAQRIYEDVAPRSPDLAICLQALGSLAKDRGNLDEAQEILVHALQVAEGSAPESLTTATSLSHLGDLAAGRGHLDQALEAYRHSLRIRELLAPASISTAYSLSRLAKVTQSTGNPKKATKLHLEAISVLEQHIGNLGGSYSTRTEFRAQQSLYYREALEILLSQMRLDDAFHVTERYRARTFLTMLAERDIVFTADIPKELDRDRRQFAIRHSRTLKRLARLSARKDAEEVNDLRQALEEMSRQRDQMEERIRRASPHLATLRYPEPLTARAAQEILEPGTLLVSYIVREETTSVFTLSRIESLEMKTVSIGESALRGKIENLRQVTSEAIPDSTLGQDRTQEFKSFSRDLYALLIAPITERIEQSERLLILPDGPLHALPFAALAHEDQNSDGGEKDRYLIEWKPFHIAPSVTAFAEINRRHLSVRKSRAAAMRLAAFGAPTYPGTFALANDETRETTHRQNLELDSVSQRVGPDFDWRPLPYTRREVENIVELFPKGQTQVFLGLDAIEERVKNLGSDIRILHLAAHVFTDDRIPLNSFVALTIPEGLPEGRDNGLLQAWEILEQVRIDADLVVLSGCLTAMGQELRGEGLIGLTRAFQYAGARSMISTLWNVDDQAQSELMIRFYRHLQSGMTKDRALQAAQLEMLRETIMSVDETGQPQEIKYASAPFYWAGVQLYGDWM